MILVREESRKDDQSPLGRTVQLRSVFREETVVGRMIESIFYREEAGLSAISLIL